MKKEIIKPTGKVTAYWWNMRTKQKDKYAFNTDIMEVLKNKGITFKKVTDKKYPDHECFVFTTPHRITYKHFGSINDGAYTALKLWYVTMGDKATVTYNSRTFTINH